MSFQLNSDREQLRGVDPTIIGSGSVRIRAGAGAEEREIFQAKIDTTSNLPRVGINRTGRRIDSIKVLTQGLGYTTNPSVQISPPTLPGGVQAIASASTDSFGRITGIGIDNPGDGYAIAPTVTISGGGGAGATAEAALDTIDFELDVNGAIRTSTSIISDTANILNLDINNLVTPDVKYRAADLKTWANATGDRWPTNTQIDKDDYYFEGQNIYQALNSGVTGLLPPFHDDGVELNGEVLTKHIGFRVDSTSAPFYGQTGKSGLFPRSITPLLGDKSDKVATTEYVLNLATNDVGGRIYVSEQIGDDDNDGRSPVNPVRTIKKACQLAWATPGVKESIIIAGGEYREDNPISIPPDASIVGDNLRLVIIRPENTGKHIFKFGDKNYVIGVTYQDKVNASGGSIGTWDFAMVFDDKQRLSYDATANGDFGTNFPIGHQFFGNESFKALFDFNLVGLDDLIAGIEIFGVNSRATGVIGEVIFDISDPTSTDEDGNLNAFQTGELKNIIRTAGDTFNNAETFFYGGAGSTKWQPSTDYALGDIVWTDAVLGDQSLTAYVYEVTTAGTSGTSAPSHNQGVDTNGTVGLTYLRNAYSFNARELVSTTPEGEVVFEGDDPFSTDTPELPVAFIDFSLQGTFTDGFQSEIYGSAEDLGGVVFYTNQLDGALNIHDFKEGDEVVIEGMPSLPNDLTFLNGKQRIYKVIEDADGRARRFVIPKKIPSSYGLSAVTDWNPADFGAVVSVKTFTKSVTLSLLNSPNKFPLAQPLARRYQDACLQIRNNIDFIADEVVGRINDEFKQEYFFPYDIGQGGGNDFKIYLGTSRFAHTWVSGGTVTAGGNTYNVTGFDYDHSATGEATITVDTAIAFNEDDTILLADLIVECVIDGVVTQKTYPSFNIPVSDQKCRRDIGHFLNALIQDLEFGSNYNIINAAQKYVDAGQIEYVDYEIIQTVRAIEYARELAIYAMRKWRTGDGSPGQTVYVPQYSTLDQYIDPTVIDDTATPACANVSSAIDTLSYLFVDVLANDASGTYLDAAYLIARNRHFIADEAYKITVGQYPSLALSNIDERKCRRDINYILNGVLRDLVLGGNTGSVNAAEFYYNGTQLVGVPQSELGATRYAFEKVRDLSILAMRNWYTNGGAGAVYTPLQSTIPLFTDNTILTDPAGTPWCAAVETSLTTSFALIDGILEYAEDSSSPTAIQPGLTTRTTGTLFSTGSIINYPANVLRDADGNTVTIRGIYDDLPIISASPYTQNASIISKIGGSGALIDGSKVKSPNCPFPGLTDGKATFPNQGKSMVASAFTIVSEKNGVGYKVIEDGYTQLVSVFCIFTVDGILCESGGYASVTNSASNFGTFSLRASGFRREAYTFDAGYDSSQGYQRAFIDNVVTAESGQTEFTVDNLGRAPLEDYILKIDGHETPDPDLEYTITKVEILQDGPPFRAIIEVSDGQGAAPIEQVNISTGQAVSPSSLDGLNFSLHRPSIVNSSSHTFEFVGSGVDYEALPENGGIKIGANEMVSEDYGRVYASGTDELGDFKVGDFVIIENRTGNIQFKGTVSISEVDFLKLSGSGVTITGFSDLSTLGGDDADDKTLPTQKAVRDFIINNLGQYIGKGFTTNQVPRALVELTDTGLISESQLPSVSPIEVYSVDDEQERLSLEGVRAGDIAVEGGEAYILNTDNDSLFLGIDVDTSLQFTVNDIFTGSGSGGKIQLTEYRPGVVKRIFIPDGGGGSGYSTSNPPTVVITDTGTSLGHVAASAVATVAGGQIVAIDIVESNGYKGGIGYNSVPTISFTNASGGSGATATAEIESRLYGDIVNSIKIVNTDSIESSDVPAETVDVIRVVNTSASDDNNWVSLSTGTISANSIVDGPIPTNILSDNSGEANSNSFLAGDSSYKKVVKSLRKIEQRYFLTTATDSTTDTMLFEVNSTNATGNLVVGHGLVATTGIQSGTTVDQIAAVQVGTDNFVRITLSDGLLSTVPAGTIIEFTRPEAPIVVSSLLSTPGSIDQILIEDGGSGFNDGDPGTRVFNNITVSGGNQGTGAKDALMDITVTGGVVTLVNVIEAGAGFTGDFTVTPPSDIGTAGSGLILRAKVATEAKLEGDITLDVLRATSDTLNADEFGTVGVSRFKKSQFILGSNGSVQLNTGIDSGLDADLLDGKQGSFYRNADNINSGRLKPAYLSGEYNIDITGESGNTITLSSQTGSLTNDLPPSDIRAGATVAVRQNDTNQLLDPPTKPGTQLDGNGNPIPISTASDYNTVLSIRGGGTGTTNQFGGVLQIGFTDGNNAYIRGSNGSVDSEQDWTSWGKIWSSQNDYSTDPANSSEVAGPNAYRLRNRTGIWYQNANTLTTGNLGDRRLPSYQTQKDFNERVRLLSGIGNGINYDIYISEVTAGVIAKLDASPFTDNPPIVKLLTFAGDDPGQIRINNIAVYDIQGNEVDVTQPIDDYTSLYAIVTGTLETGGNFTFTDANGDEFPAVKIGDDTSEIAFEDYRISSYDGNADGMPDGNTEIIRLESNSGTPRLIMGREDGLQGSATSPKIWFRSSATTPTDVSNWYNSGFEASGGNDNNGSGTLNVLVTDPNSFTIGSNVVWNAGNTLITATNAGSTYTQTGGNSNFDSQFPDNNVSIRSLVMRDENGDFAANVITADLTGTASGNLPINGGTLTGGLQIGDTNNDATLVVYGESDFFGNVTINPTSAGGATDFTVNTDILHVDGTDQYVGIGTSTPGVKLDIIQSTGTNNSATGTTLLRLTNDVGNDLNQQKTFIDFALTDGNANFTPQVRIGAEVGQNDDADSQPREGSGAFVVYTATGTSNTAGDLTEKLRVDYRGYTGILTSEPTQPLHVEGNAFVKLAFTAEESILIGDNTNNSGAPLYFNGSTTAADGTTRGEDADGNDVTGYNSNFRIGNSIIDDDIFEITATDGDAIAGGSSKYTFKSIPAIAVEGSSNRVAINGTSFSGTDPNETDGDGNNIVRDYQFNIEGDVNFNGTLFQNNSEFVTSRWTESPNGNNIYRPSFVGINFVQPGSKEPAYPLEVYGGTNILGSSFTNQVNSHTLHANGDKQWLDTYGVMKANRNSIQEDITIPQNTNCMSAGPIEIASGTTITIEEGASWSVV